MFNSLNISNDWNIPQKHQHGAGYAAPCFNCGDPDHGVPKCPKPIDQSRIDKAKAEFSRNGGGRQGRGAGARGSGDRWSGRGRGDGGKANTRGKWQRDGPKTLAVASSGGDGLVLNKGKWHMMCRSCGQNSTHTTGFHARWAAGPTSFTLPANHLYWTKSGKTPIATGSGGSVASAATALSVGASTAGSLSARVGPLIAQYKTGPKDSQFASFLADFKRVFN